MSPGPGQGRGQSYEKGRQKGCEEKVRGLHARALQAVGLGAGAMVLSMRQRGGKDPTYAGRPCCPSSWEENAFS